MCTLLLTLNLCQFFIFPNATFNFFNCLNNFYSLIVQERALILPISSQMFCQFLGSQALAHTRIAWKPNTAMFNLTPFLPHFLEHLLLSTMLWYGVSLWSQCWLCSFPALCYPQPSLLGWQSRERKVLNVLHALFNHSENIGVLSGLFSHKSKTQQRWCSHLLWRKLSSLQSDLVHI